VQLAAHSQRKTTGLLLRIAGLAVLYIITGKLGLQLGAVAGFATLVWPPAGVSLAALLLAGPRLWPGVSIGALVVNLWSGAPLAVAGLIALGNTLEVLGGVYALGRVRGFQRALDRVTDVIALVVLAAVASTLLSATVGASALRLGGLLTRGRFGEAWGAWWLGDAIGIMVVTPLVLTWAARVPVHISLRRWLEGAALATIVVGIVLLTFASPATAVHTGFWRTNMIAPPLVWAALRFGPRGAATATALVAAIAIGCTAAGMGPFAGGGNLSRDLFFLQTFIGVLAVTFLALAAAVAERMREQEARLIAEKAEHAAVIADEAKSDFVAVMSHELRTPLTAIVGYAELLRDEITGPLSAPQKAQLERIHVASKHLTALIDQILTFSKLESGREGVLKERVDIVALLREVADTTEQLVKERGLRFSFQPAPIFAPVFTDPGKVRQILLNLISNAVKFTDQGEIQLTAQIEDGQVAMRVSDTGIGIEPTNLPRIFDPFWQAEQGLDRKMGGTGLGLNVSRRLARAIGGELLVHSTPGKGSTFTLTCPVGDETAAQQ
jgi:signal transduction histidine kinase